MSFSSSLLLRVFIANLILTTLTFNAIAKPPELKPQTDQDSVDAATYVIRLPEQSKVGQRYKIEMQAEQNLERNIRQGETLLNSEKSLASIELQATVEVLKVNDRKQETKCHYLIHKVSVKAEGRETEILAPETEIIAEISQTGNQYSRADGKDLSEHAKHLLPRLISLDTGEVTQGKLFGSDTPRQVGDSWEADPKALVALVKERHLNTSDKSVSGKATLKKVHKVDSQVLLEISFETLAEIANLESPIPIAEPVSASVKILQTITIPETPTTGPIAQTHTVITKQILRGKPGTKMAGQFFDGVNSETRKIKYEYLP